MNSASADTKVGSPTPKSKTEKIELNKSAEEKFKEDFKIFRSEMKIYEEKRQEINRTFMDSLQKAQSDARAGKSPSMTQMQKRQGGVAKQEAIFTATLVRDAAIASLGLPPTPPTPPVKMPVVENEKRKNTPVPSSAPPK